MNETKTPELDRLAKVKEESQKIGEFLEWLLLTKRYQIAKYGRTKFTNDRLYPINHGSHGLIEELLAKYFGIDLEKVEAEKQKIYEMVAAEAKKK